jgi:hypothetical protein
MTPLPYIEQAKNHIINTCIPLLKPHHRKMVIPCLLEDYEDYRQALELPEVKAAIPQQMEVILQPVTKDGKPIPVIAIATMEDAANGNLERYLKSMGL